jgi:hypothetical protein
MQWKRGMVYPTRFGMEWKGWNHNKKNTETPASDFLSWVREWYFGKNSGIQENRSVWKQIQFSTNFKYSGLS